LDTSEAARRLIEGLLTLATAVPLVVAGMRKQPATDRLKLLGLGALVFLSTLLATCAPGILGFREPWGLAWNWLGKLACLIVIALLLRVLPSGTLQKSGILRLPAKDSALPVFVTIVVFALLGYSAGVAPGTRVGAESLAFQLTMPSLAEEPVFRAILPALLSTALGSPWRLGKAHLGWWWLAIAVVFGAGHGIAWSHEYGLKFDTFLFILTGIVGLVFGWLAARCLSVWPCVICHSLLNATGLAVAMISG
jgi:uncharacterized protein